MRDREYKQNVQETGIAGVLREELKIVETPRGDVLRLLRKGTLLAPDFPSGLGEIYFSEILPNQIKAWKKHRKQSALFAVPSGRIMLVCHDDRQGSPTCGRTCEFILGRPDNYCLLRVPADLWYGFSCLGDLPAIVCNCPDTMHDPDDSLRLPFNTAEIPYTWRIS